MAYLETIKKGKRKYYYLSTTLRIGNSFKKVRIYLGRDINKAEMNELMNKYKPSLKKKVDELKRKSGKVFITLDEKQKKELEEIKNRYNSAIKKLNAIEYEVYEKNHLINFTFNTNAIEGSTVTLTETSIILEDKITPEGRTLREIHEVENTKKAYQLLKTYKGGVDTKVIKKIHFLLTHNILGTNAGKFRKIRVYMGGSKHIPPKPEDVEKEMKSLIRWYGYNKDKYHPITAASYIHSEFIRIHPFVDGNGRTGRLLLNFMLMKQGWPPICIKLKEKLKYINFLEKSRDGNIENFLGFIVKHIKSVEIPEKIESY